MFSAFPFLRILLPFTGGIVLAIYLEVQWQGLPFIAVACFALTLAETFIFKFSQRYALRHIPGILYFGAYFILGICMVYLNRQQYAANHISHFTFTAFEGKITDPPVEKTKTYRLVVNITQVKRDSTWIPASGKILCYVQKNKFYIPRPGDVIVSNAPVENVSPPKNPGQFDYRQYLAYHNVFQQAYIRPEQVALVKHETSMLRDFAYGLRQDLIQSFKANGLSGNQLSVAGALLFGITDQLDPALIRSYAGTGALHVLSVSGLHVAIIYGFLQFTLAFLGRRKYGNIVLGVVILCFIWFYALLTGLTPSVLRSATMFTFIVCGQMLSRSSSAYNSLAASAFILLCINPFYIMETGFQLSYLAVAGILIFYPLIYNQIQVKTRWRNAIWQVTAVSIAAQLATLPLGLLYFHQFPNYFILSNLIVIPLSGVILYTGVIASVLYLVPFIQKPLVYILDWLIWLLNMVVQFLENLPYAVADGISISIAQTALLYAMFIAWLAWYKTAQPAYIKFVLISIALICVLQVGETFTQQQQKKVIVYHVPRQTAIDFIYGRQHIFIADSSFYHDEGQLLFHVKQNWDNLGLNDPIVFYTHRLPKYYRRFMVIRNRFMGMGNMQVELLDDTYNYRNHDLHHTQYLLLTKNAAIHLEKMHLENPAGITVVADASNKPGKIKRWKAQAEKRKIRFIAIADNGAVELNMP